MKKKDILSFIDARKKIEKYQKFDDILSNKLMSSVSEEDSYLNSIVSFKEIENELLVLKREVDQTFKDSEKAQEVIRVLSPKCNHEVRLKHYNVFGSNCRCVFCDKSISEDIYGSWEDSINRNRHSVTIESNVRYDDDGYEEVIDRGYSVNQIYDIIIQSIKDLDMEDEVDLVELIGALNLRDCLVRNEKFSREDYILIIDGSNKEYLNGDSYVSKDYNKNSLEVLNYFRDMFGIKVCFVTSQKVDNNSSNLKVIEYDSLESFNKVIESIRDIPFKCVFDFSSLFKVFYEKSLLTIEDYYVNFEELFLSNLIVVNEFNDKSAEEVCDRVRKLIKE